MKPEAARRLGLHVGRPFSNSSCCNCVVKFVRQPKVEINCLVGVGVGVCGVGVGDTTHDLSIP